MLTIYYVPQIYIYAWLKSLKSKTSKAVLNDDMEIVNEADCKPNKIWVDQGREFHSKLMQ